jgi:DNA replication and repair protein RecF
MPCVKNISLFQFKNYQQKDFSFPENITGICGLNGSGKTNLLDAIYYLCFTKSYFSGSDGQLVKNDCSGFRISGVFGQPGNRDIQVSAVLRENGKKEIRWDGELYTRVSTHIGKLPAVVIAPDDIELITGGSEGRRKFLDAMLCQIDAGYMQHLMVYNKLLLQRNSLLKQMAENPSFSPGVLEILDEQLADNGADIYQKRLTEIIPFLQKATDHYVRIAGKTDHIKLTYQSQLHADGEDKYKEHFLKKLKEALPRDKVLQRTTVGIHRDDLLFEMMQQPFKQTGSQGQRKSLLFALKLTEYEWLENAKGHPPILLLDDVFEKLDDERMENLLREVCLEKKGQVFITDTQQERLEKNLKNIGAGYAIIQL